MKEQTRGKRLLSFLLCFVMIFGMLPMSAIPAQAASNGAPKGVFLDLGGTDISQRIYLDESKPYIRAKETNYNFYLNTDIGPEASLPDDYYGSFIRYSPINGSLYICNNTVDGYYFNVPSIFVSDTTPKDITIDIYGKVKLYKPQPYNGSTSTTAATALIVNASGGNITINGMKKNGANSILSIATADGRNSGFLNTHMGAYIDLDGTGSLTLGGNLDCYMKVQHQQNPISVYVPGSFNVTENASLSIENESKASSDSDLPTVVPINASEFVVDTTKKVDISARNLVNGSKLGPVEMIHGKFVAKNAEIVKLYYPGQVSDSTVVATDGVEEIGLERVNQNGLTINFIKNPGKKPFPTEIFIGNETFSDTNKYYYNGIGFVSEKIGLRAPEAEYDYATGTLALGHYTIRAYYGTGENDYIKSTQFTGNWEVAAPTGVTVSGTATSFNSDTEDVILQLIEDGATEAAYEVTVNGNSATYSIEGVLPATYTLKVMKKNHVTREYTVTVASDNVAQDVKIHLLGDVTGDGYVDMKDWGRMRSHINETNMLTDYALACADVTKDGNVDMKDWGRMRSHINETNPLW